MTSFQTIEALPVTVVNTGADEYFKDEELTFPDLMWFVERHALWLGEANYQARPVDLDSLPESPALYQAQNRGWEQVQFLGVIFSMNSVRLEEYIEDDASEVMSSDYYRANEAEHLAEITKITGFESATQLRATTTTTIRRTSLLKPEYVLAEKHREGLLDLSIHDNGTALSEDSECLIIPNGFTVEQDLLAFHRTNPYYLAMREAATQLSAEDLALAAAVHTELRGRILEQLRTLELTERN